MTNNFVRYHLPFYLFAAIILTVSSMPHFNPPNFEITFLDKIAHFIEYSIFSFLALRSLGKLLVFRNRNKLYWGVFIISVVFAALDEWHQAYIPGRFSDIYDFIADFFGSIIVVLAVFIRSNRRPTMNSRH
jgi:VanZ family protein